MHLGRWLCFGAATASAGCADPPACVPPPTPVVGPVGNVVLVVLDDVGVDKVGAYGVHPSPAPTPNLDALAARGVRFTSAYVEPVCSSTRAALLTGRRPIRTGIGTTIDPDHGPDLAESEVLLPEALGPAYASMAVGKWHLTTLDADAAEAPLRHGFGRFDGILDNPDEAVYDDGRPRGYFHWERDIDGVLTFSDEYLVTAQADAAIDAVKTLPEPYFLYVAFSGIHGPVHLPPTALWAEAVPADEPGLGDAMLEALDHELGRLLAAIGDTATVLVIGDNGTQDVFVRPPADPRRAKDSVYTGGTHVPLIVAGPGIAPAVRDALAHATDVFPTVLDLAGIPAETFAIDGTSLVPHLASGTAPARRCLVVEQFRPIGDIRNRDTAMVESEFTLVRHKRGPDELYRRDPYAAVEGPDLLAAGALEEDAAAALRRMRARLRQDP